MFEWLFRSLDEPVIPPPKIEEPKGWYWRPDGDQIVWSNEPWAITSFAWLGHEISWYQQRLPSLFQYEVLQIWHVSNPKVSLYLDVNTYRYCLDVSQIDLTEQYVKDGLAMPPVDCGNTQYTLKAQYVKRLMDWSYFKAEEA